MGMFDPMAQSPLSTNPPSVQQQPHHPQAHQQPTQNMVPQQPNHYNSNMSNNQHIKTEHNPVGAWQRGGWDSGIHSGNSFFSSIQLFLIQICIRCHLTNTICNVRSLRSLRYYVRVF